ncbi:DUF618 domain-containing protein [Talaromyces proteolyticus]|uniref:DUF618 domain-containing protein n=1 Tax=Talaromyces proteolyticus TaxID=1131652 RepID=A0AAD4L4P3_9EURO|nr:DUF618 domain-containing protein [Talaromyces proteolyticus]KAH8704158.1 DUF618 domain-containing protein [Talaromyces proteolyticus]
MAYTDDAVRAKLSALNETQEGIVTVAQWVMFHRRHADRTAQLWLQKLKDSPANKRLNLIYLANEVAQQSKARRKADFLIAFSPIIAEAMSVAYKGSSNDIQQKLRRVVEVWRQRAIFEQPIQEAVESRVDELDKNRSSTKKPLLGGSFFGSGSGSIPAEFQPLVPLQVDVSKLSVTSGSAVNAANAEFDKSNDPSKPDPSPPVHAARLSQLLKALANAESSVSEIIKSRQSLIDGLEKLLDSNRASLAKENSLLTQLSEKKADTESRKRDVEDAIMRGLSAENSPAIHNGGDEDSRPEIETLTPPPVESLTPVDSPGQFGSAAETSQPHPFTLSDHQMDGPADLHDFSMPDMGHEEAARLNSKRRKVTHEEEYGG